MIFQNKDEEILLPVVAKLPWMHSIMLIEKIKDKKIRFWYAYEALPTEEDINLYIDLEGNGDLK